MLAMQSGYKLLWHEQALLTQQSSEANHHFGGANLLGVQRH